MKENIKTGNTINSSYLSHSLVLLDRMKKNINNFFFLSSSLEFDFYRLLSSTENDSKTHVATAKLSALFLKECSKHNKIMQ